MRQQLATEAARIILSLLGIDARLAARSRPTPRAAAEVRRGVDLASETLRVECERNRVECERNRVEYERNRVGRATTNDLLAAETALRRQRTQSQLAGPDICGLGSRWPWRRRWTASGSSRALSRSTEAPSGERPILTTGLRAGPRSDAEIYAPRAFGLHQLMRQ